MTLYFDKTTEAIAHFVGLFAIALEEIRLRDAYEEFKAHQKAQEEPPQLPSVPVTVKAPYELKDFDPRIPYRPAEPEQVEPTPGLYPGLRPPEIPIARPGAEIDTPPFSPAAARARHPRAHLNFKSIRPVPWQSTHRSRSGFLTTTPLILAATD
ncbi:hypothetical protein [Sinorhizobium fredii]|uniref:hypothetical protein n=1 Tax=Rhizobium fredii TaxID=380 RepID=UPI0002E50F96|nr:hypothetical protein [Sinorhizobium fredii]